MSLRIANVKHNDLEFQHHRAWMEVEMIWFKPFILHIWKLRAEEVQDQISLSAKALGAGLGK